MDNSKLIDYINNEIECDFIDFKLFQYDWSNPNSKEDFLVDVISMSNSDYSGDKYIITGVKVKTTGERVINGIDLSNVLDSANYQQFVSENIEPCFNVDFKVLDYDNKKFGIFKISNCNDKPYMLKKKFGKYENGFIKVRRGSRNTNISRYILDAIYKSKQPSEMSNFKISGIVGGKIDDNIILKSFDFFPDLEEKKDEITELFNSINSFKLDDIVYENNQVGETIATLRNAIFPVEKISVDEEIVKNIKKFANRIELSLEDTFFDIGDACKRLTGWGGGITGVHSNYEYIGSKKSLKKYKLILTLDTKIGELIGWANFLYDVKEIKYIQLAITEIGNIPDEEIQVNLEIPKDVYVFIDDFPQACKEVVEEISADYASRMFMPHYDNTISDYRGIITPSSVHIPTINPFVSSEVKSIDNIYDFIDYDEVTHTNKVILSFTIKNLKVGETMAFPGNIFFKGKICTIPYSIISKKGSNKVVGEIVVSN